MKSRVSLILAALLVGVIVGLGVIVFVGGDDDEGNNGNGAGTPPAETVRPTTEHPGPSVCGLHEGEWNTAAAPDGNDVRWLIQPGGLAAPSIEGTGPGTADVRAGHSCFARNPLGAVMAAMWFLADAENPSIDRGELATARVVTLEAADAEIGPAVPIGGQFAGYRFLAGPTPDVIDVELLIRADQTAEGYVGVRVTQVWEFGDWWVDWPDSGVLEQSAPGGTDGFVSWGAEGLPSEASGHLPANDSAGAALARPPMSLTAGAPAGDRPWENDVSCLVSLAGDTEALAAEPRLSRRESCWFKFRIGGVISGDQEAREEFLGADRAGRTRIINAGIANDAPLSAQDIEFLNSDSDEAESQRKSWPRYYGMTPDERREEQVPDVDLNTSCGATDIGCWIGSLTGALAEAVRDVVSSTVDTVSNSAVANLADAMMGAWDGMMRSFLTSWLNVGLLVDLEGDSVGWLTDSLAQLTAGLAVIGVMVAGVWTVMYQRAERARQAAEGLLRLVLVSGGGVALMTLAIPAADVFSEWIISEAGVSTSGWQLAGAGVAAANPGIAIIVGMIGVLATMFQWLIMIARVAVLPLLIAAWPLSAAMALFRGTEQSFSTMTRWILALVLYKPAAAIVYAFAWRLRSSDDIAEILNGLILIVLAVFCLPALLRLLAPATSALGASSSGSMALAATGAVVATGVAAGAAVATGGASGAASASGAAGTSTAGGSTAGGTTALPASLPTGGGDGAGAPGATSPALGPDGPGGEGAGTTASGAGGPGLTAPAGADGGSSGGAPATTADGSGARGLQTGANFVGGTVAGGADNDGSGVIGGDER